MRTVGIGIQEFETIRGEGTFYVDKTGFIPRWFRKKDIITLITRPRRFGKTLTIDMMNCFFSISYAGRADLFDGLAVSRDPDMMAMQGSVPVINISFAGIKAKTFRSFLTGLAGRIALLLDRYRFLLDAGTLTEDEKKVFLEMSRIVPKIPNREKDEDDYLDYLYMLTHIFHFLSVWLNRHYGKKVYIFMDEYDTPIQVSYMHHYYDDAIEIMREMFSETFKENEYLGRAVITGITRIAKESLFSDMNNLAVCSVVSGGYDRDFGFTEEEMNAALDEYGVRDKKGLVRFWYDGFTVGRQQNLYNPWSVINFLSKKDSPPEDYWAQSGGVGLIDHLVRHGSASLKEGFEALLGGGAIQKPIHEDLVFPMLNVDENAVWSLLIAAGYARPVPQSENGLKTDAIFSNDADPSRGVALFDGPYHDGAMPGCIFPETRICLTNYESRLCLAKMVKAWFDTRAGNFMTDFARALLKNDIHGMNETMQQVVLLCASSFDSGIKPSGGSVAPENFFHALTLGMLTCLSGAYHVKSNRESGYGRFDVEVIPRDSERNPDAFILEFKVFSKKERDETIKDTARRARRQIDDNRYDAELIDYGIHPDRIRKYGFGFRGKEVVIVE